MVGVPPFWFLSCFGVYEYLVHSFEWGFLMFVAGMSNGSILFSSMIRGFGIFLMNMIDPYVKNRTVRAVFLECYQE